MTTYSKLSWRFTFNIWNMSSNQFNIMANWLDKSLGSKFCYIRKLKHDVSTSFAQRQTWWRVDRNSAVKNSINSNLSTSYAQRHTWKIAWNSVSCQKQQQWWLIMTLIPHKQKIPLYFICSHPTLHKHITNHLSDTTWHAYNFSPSRFAKVIRSTFKFSWKCLSWSSY